MKISKDGMGWKIVAETSEQEKILVKILSSLQKQYSIKCDAKRDESDSQKEEV